MPQLENHDKICVREACTMRHMVKTHGNLIVTAKTYVE